MGINKMKVNKGLLIKRVAVIALTAVATITQAHAEMGFDEIVASWFMFVFFGAGILIVGFIIAGKIKAKNALKRHLSAGLIIPMNQDGTDLKSKKTNPHGIVDTSRE